MKNTSRSLVAAFAIENRVDFRVEEQLAKAQRNIVFEFSKKVEGPDYFRAVRQLMHDALKGLHDRFAAEYSQSHNSIFDAIEAMVISTLGVVPRYSDLVQLTLWNWTTNAEVVWEWNGKQKAHFQFVEEIQDIVTELDVGCNFEEFTKRILVVNDVVACAAVEYERRLVDLKKQNPEEFVYIKAHDGINAGVIEKNLKFTKVAHAELGHLYPNYHDVDLKNGFKGVCPYHNNCLEGLVSTHSLYERARGDVSSSPIVAWTKLRTKFESDPNAETLFCKAVIGSRGKRGLALGVDIVAHYIAQLVHHIALSPLMPEHVVLGGRLATEEVLAATKLKVLDMMNSYPARSELMSANFDEYLRLASVTDKRSIELIGGMVIGRSLALQKDSRSVSRATRSPSRIELVISN
ncbi:MAG: fructokinase [Alphaproteobacteria bacterium]|jgi:predicted NBD/HSP70 family sugar kinase|nr:fructokinase [Alphaproteobacteria bacterium]